ncbi:hypothetical protein ES695_13635 [Candidatus Atribacteria bacterium 1244-E10-H5-B2]|nr:MAG: hypothetical protein ES695_13635 [Candidatus Atribacteria bacterium 1244-E10-H5-B2]
MKMTEETEKMLIRKIAEIFAKLPELNGKVHCNTSVSIEGDIILNFDNPLKRELTRLFKERYISPAKNISKFIK